METSPAQRRVLVCVHQRLTDAKPSCGGRGGVLVAELLEREICRRRLTIPVERFICFGRCEEGPNVRLAPGGQFFHGVAPGTIPEIGQAILQFLGVEGP